MTSKLHLFRTRATLLDPNQLGLPKLLSGELSTVGSRQANPIGAAYALQSKLPGELNGKLLTAKQLAEIVPRGNGGWKMSAAAFCDPATFRLN